MIDDILMYILIFYLLLTTMPHITISSTMDFKMAKRAHHHKIVDEIITCDIIGLTFSVRFIMIVSTKRRNL